MAGERPATHRATGAARRHGEAEVRPFARTLGGMGGAEGAASRDPRRGEGRVGAAPAATC